MTEEGFQDMVHGLWTSNEGSIQEKITSCLESLDKWGKSLIKDIREEIKKLHKCLKDLEPKANQEGSMEEYKKVENKLDELLEKEEIMWGQRARADWLKFGDRNIGFFHKKSSQRKDRNWVSKIKDNQGFVYYDEEQKAQIVIDFFQELFLEEAAEDVDRAVSVVESRVTPEIRQILDPLFIEEKVK